MYKPLLDIVGGLKNEDDLALLRRAASLFLPRHPPVRESDVNQAQQAKSRSRTSALAAAWRQESAGPAAGEAALGLRDGSTAGSLYSRPVSDNSLGAGPTQATQQLETSTSAGSGNSRVQQLFTDEESSVCLGHALHFSADMTSTTLHVKQHSDGADSLDQTPFLHDIVDVPNIRDVSVTVTSSSVGGLKADPAGNRSPSLLDQLKSAVTGFVAPSPSSSAATKIDPASASNSESDRPQSLGPGPGVALASAGPGSDPDEFESGNVNGASAPAAAATKSRGGVVDADSGIDIIRDPHSNLESSRDRSRARPVSEALSDIDLGTDDDASPLLPGVRDILLMAQGLVHQAKLVEADAPVEFGSESASNSAPVDAPVSAPTQLQPGAVAPGPGLSSSDVVHAIASSDTLDANTFLARPGVDSIVTQDPDPAADLPHHHHGHHGHKHHEPRTSAAAAGHKGHKEGHHNHERSFDDSAYSSAFDGRSHADSQMKNRVAAYRKHHESRSPAGFWAS